MSLWLTEQEPFQELAGVELRRGKNKNAGSQNYCLLRGVAVNWGAGGDAESAQEIRNLVMSLNSSW